MKIDINWFKSTGISLDQISYDVGVTTNFLDDLKRKDNKIFLQVRNTVVSSVLSRISGEWSDWVETEEGQPISFYGIKNGVYVIRAGNGFEMDYDGKRSPVMYIGKGSVRSRLQSHLRGKLFDFWQSLGSVPLEFIICSLNDCIDASGESADRILEARLIREFNPHGVEDDYTPLLNKSTPRLASASFEFSDNWKSSIQRRGQTKTTDWLLRPARPEKWKGALR